jgi:hypothetical protein
LNRPQILLTQTTSALGIYIPVAGLLFGDVANIYDTCDRYQIGDNVLFDPTDCILLREGGIDYYVVEEQKIFFSEYVAP